MILLPFEEIRRIRGVGFAQVIHLPLRLGFAKFSSKCFITLHA